MTQTFSPIVLFVYNRPEHTKLTLASLENNHLANDSDLFIFSDGPKNSSDQVLVNEVRTQISDGLNFKSVSINASEINRGLAKSVIDGVTKIIKEYGNVIVLEDDIVTSPYFLTYMNIALDSYSQNNKVFSISGFNYPSNVLKIPRHYPHDYYFSYRSSSWGWATWKDRWLDIDWDISDFSEFIKSKKAIESFNKGGEDLAGMLEAQMRGEIDSWAIRWNYAQYKKGRYTLYPVHSYVNNIGMDGSGVHCGATNSFHNDLSVATKKISQLPNDVFLDEEIITAFYNVYKTGYKTKFKKVIKKILPYSLTKLLKNIIKSRIA